MNKKKNNENIMKEYQKANCIGFIISSSYYYIFYQTEAKKYFKLLRCSNEVHYFLYTCNSGTVIKLHWIPPI